MTPSSTELVDVLMPETGVSVTEGTIVALHKQVGDYVKVDEAIADIATDKIDTEVPAPLAGTIAEVLVEVGETVLVGAPIVRVDPSGTPSAAPAPGAPAPAAAGPAAAPAPASVELDADGGSHSPIVERMAAAHGIDLATVAGTGRGGRVRKQDLLDHIATLEAGGEPPAPAPAAAPEPVVEDRSVAISSMRRAIGANMRRSLAEAPQVTTWIEVDMTAIQESRKQLGLTALPLIARCAVDTLLHDHPAVNAWLENDRLTQHEDVNLGIAVSLGAEGLIVPVVHAAGALSVAELGERIKDLAGRARERKLTAQDLADGTFTITNAGRHGTYMQTPIVNRPQAAILDVQGITRQPAVVTAPDGSETIEPRWMSVVGLSWDHAAIDGDLASEFLASLKARLEAWSAS